MATSFSSSHPIKEPQFFQLNPEGIAIFKETAKHMRINNIAEESLGKGQVVSVGVKTSNKEVTYYKKDDFNRVKEEAASKIKKFDKSLNALIEIWNECISINKPLKKEQIVKYTEELEKFAEKMRPNAEVVLREQVGHANRLFEAIGHRLEEVAQSTDIPVKIPSIHRQYEDEEVPPSPQTQIPTSSTLDIPFTFSVDETFPKFPTDGEHTFTEFTQRFDNEYREEIPNRSPSLPREALSEEVADDKLLGVLQENIDELSSLNNLAKGRMDNTLKAELNKRGLHFNQERNSVSQLKKGSLTEAEKKHLEQYEKAVGKFLEAIKKLNK